MWSQVFWRRLSWHWSSLFPVLCWCMVTWQSMLPCSPWSLQPAADWDGPWGTASTLVNIFEKWDQYGYPFACHCQNLWHLGRSLRMFGWVISPSSLQKWLMNPWSLHLFFLGGGSYSNMFRLLQLLWKVPSALFITVGPKEDLLLLT